MAPKTPLNRRNFHRAVRKPDGRRRCSIEEVDDHDIELLAVAVASANALFDALRIPGKVVIDHEIAELKVDAFGRRFGGDHDGGFIAEVFDQAARMSAPGDPETRSGALILFEPTAVDVLRVGVVVRAIEDHDFAGELGLFQDAERGIPVSVVIP